MNHKTLAQLVLVAVKKLYSRDASLFEKNLCERCLVHRLALYLEELFPGFYADCEFNKSFYKNTISNKILSNVNGNYVDIVVHKRNNNPGENLLCFEIKKSSNYVSRDKDRENLKILTRMGRFEYELGFYIILGSNLKKTQIEIYSKGEKLLFNN